VTTSYTRNYILWKVIGEVSVCLLAYPRKDANRICLISFIHFKISCFIVMQQNDLGMFVLKVVIDTGTTARFLFPSG